jgi:hypothetical protein
MSVDPSYKEIFEHLSGSIDKFCSTLVDGNKVTSESLAAFKEDFAKSIALNDTNQQAILQKVTDVAQQAAQQGLVQPPAAPQNGGQGNGNQQQQMRTPNLNVQKLSEAHEVVGWLNSLDGTLALFKIKQSVQKDTQNYINKTLPKEFEDGDDCDPLQVKVKLQTSGNQGQSVCSTAVETTLNAYSEQDLFNMAAIVAKLKSGVFVRGTGADREMKGEKTLFLPSLLGKVKLWGTAETESAESKRFHDLLQLEAKFNSNYDMRQHCNFVREELKRCPGFCPKDKLDHWTRTIVLKSLPTRFAAISHGIENDKTTNFEALRQRLVDAEDKLKNVKKKDERAEQVLLAVEKQLNANGVFIAGTSSYQENDWNQQTTTQDQQETFMAGMYRVVER